MTLVDKLSKYLVSVGFEDTEIIEQGTYLQQNREHCAHAPLAIISDRGGLIGLSLNTDFTNFLNNLGYWCEPWNDFELCILPTSENLARRHAKIFDNFKSSQKVDSYCQQQFETIKYILSQVPEYDYPAGMHQFVWVRMKNYIHDGNQLTRETIASYGSYIPAELEEVFDAIRNMPCVANIWSALD